MVRIRFVTCAKEYDSKIYHNSTINAILKCTLCDCCLFYYIFFLSVVRFDKFYSRWLIAAIKLHAIAFHIFFFLVTFSHFLIFFSPLSFAYILSIVPFFCVCELNSNWLKAANISSNMDRKEVSS